MEKLPHWRFAVGTMLISSSLDKCAGSSSSQLSSKSRLKSHVVGTCTSAWRTPLRTSPLNQTTCNSAPEHSALQSTAEDQSLALFKRQLQGKNFLCTQCGKCCTGSGEVWISAAEAERIAEHLGCSKEGFLAGYTKSYTRYEGWHLLKTHPENKDCVFLKDKLCSIHTVRPSQCCTYPWWPEMMDETMWTWEKENICEGFDHPDAPPLDVTSAAQQLKQATKDLQLRLLSRKTKPPLGKGWNTGALPK